MGGAYVTPAHDVIGCKMKYYASTKMLQVYASFPNILFYFITIFHPFNGPLSGTTQVSQYQKGKTSLYLLEQEIVSANSISWAICKSAPCPDR